jgi:intein/homing endonuclease
MKIKIPQTYEPSAQDVMNVIAPAGLEISSNYLKLGDYYVKTFFIFTFPRYLASGWFSPIINLPEMMDISIFVHPMDSALALKNLRKRVAQVEAEIMEKEEKGHVRDPLLETAYRDIESLRDALQQAREKLFDIGLYITIYASTIEDLNKFENNLDSMIESKLVYAKPALFRQLEGLDSILPLCQDKLATRTPLNSGPASSLFPFISSDLSSEKGILYGVNMHNNSLIIFDRFSLENANAVVFAKAGSGKSIKGDELVLIKQKGKTKLTKIGSLVEKTIKKQGLTKIDEELEGVINPEIEVYSFNKDLKGGWSKVTVAARKTAPGIFYKFKTRSGREITTTGDHNMLILKNGQVMISKSSEVKKEEFIPLPRNIQESSQPTQFLNLLELLKKSKNTYIQSAENLIKENHQILKKKKIDERLDKYLYKYRDGRAIPVHYFLKILEHLGVKTDSPKLNALKAVSQNGKSKCSLRADFVITNSLLRLLGYITAEGTIRDDVIMISNKDREALKDIDDSLNELKIPFYYGNQGIIIASRVFIEIIKALGGKGKSKDKRVPAITFNLEKGKIAQYLSAYFEGDGGVENNQMTATSKSSQLISEITYLLYYFGITARISKTKKKTPDWRQKKTYWRLTISGQENLRRFKENINFVSFRKKQQLSGIIKKNRNTNVDIIPELSSIFSKIYQLFAPQLPNIPEISEWKRNAKNPSPQNLQKVINQIEQKIILFKELNPVFSGLNNLPAVERLPIKHYNKSLQAALVDRQESNASYKTIQKAAQFVWQNYQGILMDKIPQLEALLAQLKILANADLFWDPIIKVEKIKNRKEKYVYDLTVDNEVFLAGRGGMFVHNSYATKLEILRTMMMGTDVIIIDPEDEYKNLANAIGGSYFKISLTSPNRVNPFDIPIIPEGEEPADVFKSHILNLTGLIKLMLGNITPEEDALLDRAITETYASRDITAENFGAIKELNPPLLEDLQTILQNTEGGKELSVRLDKFVHGSYAGFTNAPTNVDISNRLIVFSIRDLEDELRPIAMYIILNFVWNLVRSKLKRRILVVDEAWWMMKYKDSASFLFGLVKRCRKYYLGVTTITQDVADFLNSEYGRPIISNSSIQLLLKQAPANIDVIAKTFNLSEAEKMLLLEASIGEGLFFAGLKHVAIKIIPSYTEDQIITTNPEQILELKGLK